MTKIVFMGTPAFSVPILEGLLEAGYEVAAVVTQPDRPVGRKNHHSDPRQRSGVEAWLVGFTTRKNQWVTRNGADSSFNT